MDILAIAGNNIKNKEWVEKVAQSMSGDFSHVLVHHYQHWETNQEFLDFEKEVEIFSKNFPPDSDFSIFAKSAGILVSLKAISMSNQKPQKCVFVGFPAYWAHDKKINFGDWLKNFSVSTLFIQHTNDPTISFEELKKLLLENSVRNYNIVELPGNSHDYPEIDTLIKLTVEFIEKK